MNLGREYVGGALGRQNYGIGINMDKIHCIYV